jgi:hypothetical protein
MAVLMLVTGTRVLSGQDPAPSASIAKPDPNAIGDARATLGEMNLRSIRFIGSGTVMMHRVDDGGAPMLTVKSYEVLIDYPASTMRVDIAVDQADAGAAASATSHHVETISGTLAWDADFVATPKAAAGPQKKRQPVSSLGASGDSRLNVAAAPLRGQAIWMTPHGFLKAALANQPALHAAGSGTEVSFYAGPHRYIGFLNSKHQVERVRAWVNDPGLGQVLIDTTYTNYTLFGTITFPTRIQQRLNGRSILDVTVSSVEANAPVHIAVPKNLGE